MFSSSVESEMQNAALVEWPREVCGVVDGDGNWRKVANESYDPCHDFLMPASTWAQFAPIAVVHSHVVDNVSIISPGLAPDCPTREDMISQQASSIPWGIVVADCYSARPPFWWGDQTLDEALLGRAFRHGVTDCYSAIRGWFWQDRGVKLPEYPRNDGWWDEGENMYVTGFTDAGFERISIDSIMRGDVLLMQIGKTPVPNHGAVWLGDGLIYHHPQPTTGFGKPAISLSRREPLGARRRYVTHCLRYVG